MGDKYKQAFQEEVGEIVAELELALLALRKTPEDTEIVGRVFRAIHIIQGSGAMFGFDDLARFAHDLKNAFDEVRNSRLKVTCELVDLSLSALDQIKAMVNETGGRGEAAERILVELRRLTDTPDTRAAKVEKKLVEPVPALPT